MKAIRHLIIAATLFAFVSEVCFGRQVRLTHGEALRYLEEADPRGEVLNAVTMLPAGTVIDVDDDALSHPIMAPYTCDSLARGPCDPSIRLRASGGFANGIRVISMPDRTPAERIARDRYQHFVSRFPEADFYLAQSTLARWTRPVKGTSQGGERELTGQTVLFADSVPPPPSASLAREGAENGSGLSATAFQAERLPGVLARMGDPAGSCSRDERPEAAVPPPRPISPLWSHARGCPLTVDNFRLRISQILAAGVPFQPLRQSIDYYLRNCSRIPNKRFLTLVDYDLPSSAPRLFLIDLATGSVHRELVSHGTRSGNPYWATSFSDANHSHASSLGFYLTREVIDGVMGPSMKLQGLSQGLNDQAYERNIEIHGADFVTPEFVASHGYAGETWGCFAVNPRDLRGIFSRIGGGSLIYAYQSRGTPSNILARTISF